MFEDTNFLFTSSKRVDKTNFMIFGTLQRCFILYKSFDSKFIRFIKQNGAI